jgi:predicted MPP superfamily phosphohydrolase
MISAGGRRLLTALAVLALAGLLLLGWMFANARAMPVVRTAKVALPWPDGAPRRPVRIALLTDTHLSGPDNDERRMARIVALINAQKPDLVLLGGDYMGDYKGGRGYSIAQSVAAFARLTAPMGVVAVPGNHDWPGKGNGDFAPIRKALEGLGITVLQNEAVRRGPLVVGGLDFGGGHYSNLDLTKRRMRALGGAPVLLAHSPERFEKLDADTPLMLAGHVHCGQIALPFYGAIVVPTPLPRRYSCGAYREGDRTLIMSGGVGTSGLPLRAFAPPDIWIVTVRPR